uniref:Uncharacterized protein n=1 Tax=Romanomermis culicivorax TaxID=13658 RepID=A0A915L003_ROMCU
MLRLIKLKIKGVQNHQRWPLRIKTFVLQGELIKYCDSDIDILLKACMKFRDLFMAETTVDPFESSLTIAGEAEGCPDECKDEMSKKRYLNEVTMFEGIELDPLKFDRNPGRHALAKLMLNSFRGKPAKKKIIYPGRRRHLYNLADFYHW